MDPAYAPLRDGMIAMAAGMLMKAEWGMEGLMEAETISSPLSPQGDSGVQSYRMARYIGPPFPESWIRFRLSALLLVACALNCAMRDGPKIRYLDKLIDELAKGNSMDKILRQRPWARGAPSEGAAPVQDQKPTAYSPSRISATVDPSAIVRFTAMTFTSGWVSGT